VALKTFVSSALPVAVVPAPRATNPGAPKTNGAALVNSAVRNSLSAFALT
jgi:hypothetical protein